MKFKNKTIRKCPACGHEAVLSQFLEKDNNRHWGGLVTSPMRVRCPSCGAKLRPKYKRLQLASTFFVFGALTIVIAFFPEHISHFGYSVGALGLIIYLLDKFRPNKDIFVNENEKKIVRKFLDRR
jgi:DNA-directed RNA polymerase subunit RPC12/RpoP